MFTAPPTLDHRTHGGTMDEVRIPAAGDPFAAHSVREAEICSHCMGGGWVLMGAENDFGEYEEYFVLCRKCGEVREGE
jgi:hypothetical protein